MYMYMYMYTYTHVGDLGRDLACLSQDDHEVPPLALLMALELCLGIGGSASEEVRTAVNSALAQRTVRPY